MGAFKDANAWGNYNMTLDNSIGIRTVEYHNYGTHGNLATWNHKDTGSLLTMDIMLAEPGTDYEGGALSVWEPSTVSTSHTPKAVTYHEPTVHCNVTYHVPTLDPPPHSCQP